MSDQVELSRLEPASFEHLVNAIALKVLGTGATGFGPGPDGGRDGWFQGESPYPSAKQKWKGIWYIQAKFHAPNLSKNAQAWLLSQLEAEITAFSKSDSKRKWPTNWILATNVDPSGGAKGTFERARQLVKAARPALATRFHIWGGRKICDFLSEHRSIAERFGHFLTPGHVISTLYSKLADERADVEDIVRYSIVRGIEEQRHTRLEQAGSAEDRRPGIDELFVDLPYADERCGARGRAVTTLARASARNHRADDDELSGEIWRTWNAHPKRAAVWFVRAGPGRGKSSIGQFFCQVQRAALILQPGGVAVHPAVRSLAKRIHAKATQVGCWPKVPRVPIWVELKSYAAWYGEQKASDPKGVASFICAMLHRDIEAQVRVKTLRKALNELNWVIVFDGLDEVPSDVKDAIASEVVGFVRDINVSSDVLSICTSRPQGYAGQFDALGGASVDLVDLPPDLALECATKVAVIDRAAADAQRAEALLKSAMASPAVRELLTTPLQAHIMAVLVRNGQRPPERKWDLYHRFYEVIREREANRDLPDPLLRELFQRDTSLIDTVHQRLGFALHTKAERASGADASLTKSEFKTLVRDVVQETRGDGGGPVIDALLAATTERLVLINTPDQGDRVRFDIRAIQEFFAAEFLYVDTPVDMLRERLELIAGDSHWREVVQFVLGALAANKRATEWIVALDVLVSLDGAGRGTSEKELARRLARGALHGALFFNNGAAETSRKTRDQLRSVMEPLASATDEPMLNVLRRVSAPESRAWILTWAIEQLGRLKANESRGALHILVNAGFAGEQAIRALDTLQTLPTSQLYEPLADIARFGLPEKHEEQVGRFKRAVENLVLQRDDCVSTAPNVVASCLWDAGRRHPDTGRKIRASEENVPDGAVTHALEKVFGTRLTIAFGGGFALSQPRLSPNAGAVLGSASTGVLRWLGLIYQLIGEQTVARTQEVLSWLGDDWEPVAALPGELAKVIPLPRDPRLTPADVSRRIGVLTDEALREGVDAGMLAGVHLRGAEFRLSGFTEKLAEDVEEVVRLLEAHPRAGWVLWAHFLATKRIPAPFSPKWVESGKIHDSLVSAVERDPFILDSMDDDSLLTGITRLGGVQDRVWASLATIDFRRPLRVSPSPSGHVPLEAVRLTLPEDSRFLPLVASVQLSALVYSVGRHSVDPRVVQRAPGGAPSWCGAQVLEQIARNRTNTDDERASAIFLMAVNAEGGWRSLVSWASELNEFAKSNLSIAAGVAVVLEIEGLWSDASARRLLSELIANNRVPFGPTGYESSRALDTILRVWRERSSAPLTSAEAMSKWLRLPTDDSVGA